MAMRIGVVCEGSHDFSVVGIILRKFCEDRGIDLAALDCLQPKLSASFDQVGGGGWGRVKMWCEAGEGKGFRVFLDQPLFATSVPYDIIVVHLDGDVYDHCQEGVLAGLNCDASTVEDIASALENAICNEWLSASSDDLSKILCCIPVRHLEAWLLAALDESSENTEGRPTKDEFKAEFAGAYPRKTKEFYAAAANDAVANIHGMRSKCLTFRKFEDEFAIRSQSRPT